ncbi:MAG: serine hydrolase domain-containing protein [Actinomycetes bacterium]
MTPPTSAYASDAIASIVDPHFDAALAAQRAPGLVYGVIADGVVVHSRGIGVRALPDGSAPDSDTVFRIASMTKSFTAATVLSLRDAQLLSLDAPVADLVPELTTETGHGHELTVRHLLTMGGGFLTDDPWGDRQQDLGVADFRRLLSAGVEPTWLPGERFEYSNLGYAVLGLVIEAVTGDSYADAVQAQVLGPLGMEASGFRVPTSAGSVAAGYVRRSTGWADEPIAASGAFSPMGGLLSSVSDLATWVGLFQALHRAPGNGSTKALTVSAQSLREMQVTQRLVASTASKEPGGSPEVTGYGFGLFEDFQSWGRSVYHSGGYPGFGSHMRWHPASGLGIVALANGTYAPMSKVGHAALRDLVVQLGAPVRQPAVKLPGLVLAQRATTAWLAAEDADGAESDVLRALFADNVDQDVPWPERVAAWRAIREYDGVLRSVDEPTTRPSPGALSWHLVGDTTGNGYRAVVMVSPHDTGLVQSIEVKATDDFAGGTPPTTDLT